ncbi:uncharacterized protein LOC110023948 [Phalaenopsis equestris]|uniref:uncharacterized protein LOC110023948 n=1 Tax=Phalaenopsis equestris TaxID=78828 RepID=UPI0009E3A029|nr:uncharacterized protein LOC110023948 [Phalaenopsis equestris]
MSGNQAMNLVHIIHLWEIFYFCTSKPWSLFIAAFLAYCYWASSYFSFASPHLCGNKSRRFLRVGFCFSSSSAEFYSLPGGVSGGAAFVRVSDGSAISPELRHIWTSRNWRKAVEFYSSVFRDLIVEGFLSSTSKSLCVESMSGLEVLALKEIGVADAVGISKKNSPPLVVAGDILHQPFGETIRLISSLLAV